MRIRITAANQKLVNKSRGKNLSANAEVNRALTEYYAQKDLFASLLMQQKRK